MEFPEKQFYAKAVMIIEPAVIKTICLKTVPVNTACSKVYEFCWDSGVGVFKMCKRHKI